MEERGVEDFKFYQRDKEIEIERENRPISKDIINQKKEEVFKKKLEK